MFPCVWTMGHVLSPGPGGDLILQLWIDDQQVAGSPLGNKEDQHQKPQAARLSLQTRVKRKVATTFPSSYGVLPLISLGSTWGHASSPTSSNSNHLGTVFYFSIFDSQTKKQAKKPHAKKIMKSSTRYNSTISYILNFFVFHLYFIFYFYIQTNTES